MASRVALLFILLAIDRVLFGEGVKPIPNSDGGAEAHSTRPPPVKTFETEEGDIIDCVDIYSQPGLKHVDRKNYKIKMTHTFPQGVEEQEAADRRLGNIIDDSWRKDGGCPDGTIPIFRRNKHFSLPEKPGKIEPPRGFFDNSTRSLWDSTGHVHAVVISKNKIHHGAKAHIGIWRPQLQNDTTDMSLAQIWLRIGTGDEVSTVEVGWMVYPGRFQGDLRPHLFTYYTNDSYRRFGCYDVNEGCNYIHTSPIIPMQAAIGHYSVIGSELVSAEFSVIKNTDGDWVFKVEGEVVGYFPGTVLPHLVQGAVEAHWGGEIYAEKALRPPPFTTTEMGSGAFPSAGDGKVAQFSQLQFVNESGYLVSPPSRLTQFVTKPECYSLLQYGYRTGSSGYTFLYGGPGRNPLCP